MISKTNPNKKTFHLYFPIFRRSFKPLSSIEVNLTDPAKVSPTYLLIAISEHQKQIYRVIGSKKKKKKKKNF